MTAGMAGLFRHLSGPPQSLEKSPKIPGVQRTRAKLKTLSNMCLLPQKGGTKGEPLTTVRRRRRPKNSAAQVGRRSTPAAQGLQPAPESCSMPTEAAVKAEETLIHVLWINAGLSCDGDSVAAVNATESPSQLRPALIHRTWINVSSALTAASVGMPQLSGAWAKGPSHRGSRRSARLRGAISWVY